MPTPRLSLALLAALLAAGPGCSLTRTGQRFMAGEVKRRGFVEGTVQTDDATVHYWDGGEGPAVLLLHGFGGDGLSTWRKQARAFAEAGYRVIIPDLLWFGQSDSAATPGLDAQGRAMRALLDHLGVAKAAVVGISYGGFVALQVAAQDPSRIDRLVIVSSPGPAFDPEDEAALLDRLGVDAASELFVPDDPSDVAILLDLTLAKDKKLPKILLRDMYNNAFSLHREAQTALLDDLPTHRGEVEALDPAAFGPSLVVWGRFDPIFPVASGERLAAWLGAPIVILEESAHGPIMEQAQDFNDAVLRFLATDR